MNLNIDVKNEEEVFKFCQSYLSKQRKPPREEKVEKPEYFIKETQLFVGKGENEVIEPYKIHSKRMNYEPVDIISKRYKGPRQPIEEEFLEDFVEESRPMVIELIEELKSHPQLWEGIRLYMNWNIDVRNENAVIDWIDCL